MRSPSSRFRPALLAAAAAVLLSSCGGGGSEAEEAAESTSADTSTSASATATQSSTPAPSPSTSPSPSAGDDPAVAQFCAEAAQFDELGNQLTAATPEQLPGLLQQAAGAFDAVQPPAEIASSWQVVGDAVQTFADTATTIDSSTPEGQAQLQTAAQQFVSVASGPDGTAVQQFGEANCATAAPTS